jgi:large subunit ribosomal protein L19
MAEETQKEEAVAEVNAEAETKEPLKEEGIINLKKDLPEIKPGDMVKVHQKIKEKNKERVQVFEGQVLSRKHGKGISATITVRKVVDGVGLEKIFPIHSPSIEKIEVEKSGKTRRSKLYYLRTAKGRKAKLKSEEAAE